ncbi:hypothetical protein JYB87_07305 [Shewanella avicenniae]|uniref:BFD-like [2Fe-2S] binding domain-containing protein n=1 Tax=Shewanella avicenniae TaxID=2814294 RepID=A0ABX7QVH4_9GAMM|nr:hypothetical protein [Shewanella avicenniae]QSX35017.1 hypothetical protein JYB87_07305 [Shewanella avicenniae]
MTKPNVQQAMQLLIAEIERQIPLQISEANLCGGKCVGCPKKMLEMLDSELSYWKYADSSLIPTLADLNRLAKIAKRTHKVFSKNGFIPA